LWPFVERILWMILLALVVGWFLFLWMVGDDNMDGDSKK
jgi:hypothetical protein